MTLYSKAEVIWAVRHEMALTLEDVLARRLRLLFLDAQTAIEAAPAVAILMARELKKNGDWVEDEIRKFIDIAKGYLMADHELRNQDPKE